MDQIARNCAPPQDLQLLNTPAALLARPKLDANLAGMAQRLHRHGLRLRPHLKTAKSIEVALLATAQQFGGITVSTVEEAEYFFAHGICDILYAVAIAPAKLERLARLHARGAEISIILDSLAAAQAASAGAQQLGVRLPVMIEIDTDGHRSGIAPDSPDLLAVGQALKSAAALELRGVMAHAGESYNCSSSEEIAQIAERERANVVLAAERLRAAGLEIAVTSIGSTPTATFARRFDGVSEVRVGVYMFQDLVMAGLGVCAITDIALSVLATVIGHKGDGTRVIIDAGWMAMSRDRGTARQKLDQGYGLVCTLDGNPLGDFVILETNQEHGLVGRRDGTQFDQDRFPIGSLIRVLPNHACATAAAFPGYYVLDERNQVVDFWNRRRGW